MYNFHRIIPTPADTKQLSDDVNDFFARYRINAGEPGSNNDAGDLVFDTNANKMKVYDGSSWGEVTSTGEPWEALGELWETSCAVTLSELM